MRRSLSGRHDSVEGLDLLSSLVVLISLINKRGEGDEVPRTVPKATNFLTFESRARFLILPAIE